MPVTKVDVTFTHCGEVLRFSLRSFLHLCDVLGLERPQRLPATIDAPTLRLAVERAHRALQSVGECEFTLTEEFGEDPSSGELMFLPEITADYVRDRLLRLHKLACEAEGMDELLHLIV